MTATRTCPPPVDASGSSGEAGGADAFARYRVLASRVAGAPLAWVVLLDPDDDPDGRPLDPAFPPAPALPPRLEPLLRGLCDRVVAAGGPVPVVDALLLPEARAARGAEPCARALLGVPLRATGTVHGALLVGDTRPRLWLHDEIAALEELAFLAAQAIETRREAQQRRSLENLVRMLGKAVENMQLGVTVTDLDGRIVYTNPAEARMHGYEVGELVGKHARILGPPEAGRALNGERLLETRSWTRETVNVRKDGSRFPVLLWSDHVADADGGVIGIVTCCEDVTERKRAEATLREIALRDPLTGLPNRVHFLERLTQAIQHARTHPDAVFAVLFLDLDRFKVVNDSLGHHVGDELLEVIAARVQSSLRPGDTVARFGGDEFAVLLEGVAGPDEAGQAAERILAALAAPIHLDGYELFTSASIGIVMSSPLIDEPEYLWRSADMAMYRAKAAGTGRYEVFDSAMHAEAMARLQLETDLRRAVDRDELRLHYQPMVALDSGRIVGFEALLRWLHPQRGMISPGEIIPAAEEIGMIHSIGEWVIREACRQLAEWQGEMGPGAPLVMSVNLSSKQLSQPHLVERLAAILREAKIDPRMLRLEITESAVVENTEHAAAVLRALKSLGVQLYMDDFGTGYSSLSYLHRLPLDALKIDRSFVSQMERGNRHSQLVETIVNLGRNVRLKVVAEGISNPEQLRLLREMGCDYGQGFLFSQPLTRGDAEEMLRRPMVW